MGVIFYIIMLATVDQSSFVRQGRDKETERDPVRPERFLNNNATCKECPKPATNGWGGVGWGGSWPRVIYMYLIMCPWHPHITRHERGVMTQNELFIGSGMVTTA